MVQYIDKAALVAEIEKLKGKVNDGSSYCNGWQQALRMLEMKLATLETEEVDLEKELDKYTADNFWALEGDNESPYLLEKDDMLKVAKHFYELGLAQKGE